MKGLSVGLTFAFGSWLLLRHYIEKNTYTENSQIKALHCLSRYFSLEYPNVTSLLFADFNVTICLFTSHFGQNDIHVAAH